MQAILLLPILLSAPCPGDPSRDESDSWVCDDGCSVCTCSPDGTVLAGGCGAENVGLSIDASSPAGEEAVVNFAIAIIVLFIALFIFVCFLMCRKGGSRKASQLVREMEDAEED